MAQEQPANQQKQQQLSQHLQNNRYSTLDHYTSITVNSQVPTLKRDNGHLNIPMDDVFMPRDDPVDVSNEKWMNSTGSWKTLRGFASWPVR